MSKNAKSKVFAGLSTGVTLEQYSRSILKQVLSMKDEARKQDSWNERTHRGIEPMLLALAMEFALKAIFVWDHDNKDPIKIHNLAKLYDELGTKSKENLNKEFKKKVLPFHPWGGLIEYNIRDILSHHANAFVEWRYPHEDREGGISFDFTTFIATLELVLDEFGRRYETMETKPLFGNKWIT